MFKLIVQKIKVYHLFWIVALLILISTDPEETIDINIHDTYFVISNLYVGVILFLIYFLMGLGYWLIQRVFKKQLIKTLTIIHSSIFLGSFIVFWITIFSARLFANSFPQYEYYSIINIVLTIIFLGMLFIASPIYITNLLLTLVRKNNI